MAAIWTGEENRVYIQHRVHLVSLLSEVIVTQWKEKEFNIGVFPLQKYFYISRIQKLFCFRPK
jgi:hypothetical protein